MSTSFELPQLVKAIQMSTNKYAFIKKEIKELTI